MKKYLILVPILVFLLATNLGATIITDTETLGDGLFATSPWDSPGATLTWSVMDPYEPTNTTGHYVYTYTFTTGTGNANEISHLIIEVSDNFTRLDLYPGTTQLGETAEEEEYPLLDTYDGSGNDNPGWPFGEITGIKWQDPDTPNADTWIITIVTNRAPMEGDFYAVDGKGTFSTYAYSVTDLAGERLLVPDTQTQGKVPEPLTLILYGLGFAGAGLYRRLRRKPK